jgi:hypothetical protein
MLRETAVPSQQSLLALALVDNAERLEADEVGQYWQSSVHHCLTPEEGPRRCGWDRIRRRRRLGRWLRWNRRSWRAGGVGPKVLRRYQSFSLLGVTPPGRPMIAWAHPTSGIVLHCAPSLARGLYSQIRGLADMLDKGYAVTATDYPGLGQQARILT